MCKNILFVCLHPHQIYPLSLAVYGTSLHFLYIALLYTCYIYGTSLHLIYMALPYTCYIWHFPTLAIYGTSLHLLHKAKGSKMCKVIICKFQRKHPKLEKLVSICIKLKEGLKS